jgi:hypothetical protein
MGSQNAIPHVAPPGNARPLPRASPHAFRHVLAGYYLTFGRLPNLVRPSLFSEKMQWRKLFDRDPLFAVLADKLAVRDFIAERIGPGRTAELHWVGDAPDDVPFARLEPPYFVKCSHRSGLNVLVESAAGFDLGAALTKLRAGFAEDYGRTHFEPAYLPVTRKILVERLLRLADGSAPLEHKLHVFGGRARVIETIIVARDRSRWSQFHDVDWQPLPWKASNPLHPQPLPRPAALEETIALAEMLAAGLDYVRVDTYDCDEGVRIGELTLYDHSGLCRYSPDEADRQLGAMWPLARPVRRAVAACLRP